MNVQATIFSMMRSSGRQEICDTLAISSYGYSRTSTDWLGPAWYRFGLPAGSKIPESSPGDSHCGTVATGQR